MKPHQVTSLFTLCGALGLLAGCATAPESRRVSAPPPSAPTVSAGTVPAAQPAVTVTVPGPGNNYVVIQAPPAPRAEAVPPRPNDQSVWVPGYWTWQNSDYAWMAGHWEVPPTPNAVWINPTWAPEGSAFRFYEGYWRR